MTTAAAETKPRKRDGTKRFVEYRSRTEEARGDLLALELEVARGKYVEWAPYEKALAAMFAAVRDEMLTLADRLAAPTAASSDREQNWRLIDAEVRLALRHFETKQ